MPTDLDLWLMGKKVPTPIIDILLRRETIFERPYRDMFLRALKKELSMRRRPEMIVGNIFSAITGNFAPPIARNVVQTMTKETIDRRYGLKTKEEE